MDELFPLTPALSLGERVPRTESRFEPLNHPLTRPSGTLSPARSGGEGRGEGEVASRPTNAAGHKTIFIAHLPRAVEPRSSASAPRWAPPARVPEAGCDPAVPRTIQPAP